MTTKQDNPKSDFESSVEIMKNVYKRIYAKISAKSAKNQIIEKVENDKKCMQDMPETKPYASSEKSPSKICVDVDSVSGASGCLPEGCGVTTKTVSWSPLAPASSPYTIYTHEFPPRLIPSKFRCAVDPEFLLPEVKIPKEVIAFEKCIDDTKAIYEKMLAAKAHYKRAFGRLMFGKINFDLAMVSSGLSELKKANTLHNELRQEAVRRSSEFGGPACGIFNGNEDYAPLKWAVEHDSIGNELSDQLLQANSGFANIPEIRTDGKPDGSVVLNYRKPPLPSSMPTESFLLQLEKLVRVERPVLCSPEPSGAAAVKCSY